MKVFPAADLFPMLPDDELQQLAEDIKAHGLREPIVVAVIDGEEMLVAGRNRLAACKIAGVEPTVRRLNGEDPTAYVISENIYRRHMTKSQRAMAVAMLLPEPEKGGRGKKRAAVIAPLFGDRLLSQARSVMAHAPELAPKVLAGMPLAEAYDLAIEIKEVKERGESTSDKLEQVRAEAPDVADMVDTGKLTIGGAVAEVRERRETVRLRQFAAMKNLHTAMSLLSPHGGDAAPIVEEFTSNWSVEQFPQDSVQLNVPWLQACKATLEGLINWLEQEEAKQ